jgi:hypothetical protein
MDLILFLAGALVGILIGIFSMAFWVIGHTEQVVKIITIGERK